MYGSSQPRARLLRTTASSPPSTIDASALAFSPRAMVTDAASMAVVKAARPAFRGAHDGVAFAANAAFLAAGYSLCAVGPDALTDPPPSGDEEVGIDGWNNMDNCYAFLYVKEEKGKKKHILMKCLVIGEFLTIDVMDIEAQQKEPYHVQINVKDFFYEEQQPKNYGDMYKNFTGFIETLNSSLLFKLDGKDADAEKKPDVEGSSSMHSSYNTSMRTTGPSGLVYPPIAPLGHDDAFPAPGAGFYQPHGGVGRGGNMHVGPNDPHFFPPIPFPASFGGPGSVLPGGRYDPIGPPDVPGFEPCLLVRRPRHPGGSTHPDLEFFQQGPNF